MGSSFFVKNRILGITAMLFCLFMVAFPEVTIRASKEAVAVWMRAVVPTMLPFLIISDYARNKGIADAMPVSVYPFFMAVMSGYPMGAKVVADCCRNDEINERDALLLLSYSMVTGPAFIIGSVGTGLYGSTLYGYVLACSHYGAAAFCWLLQKGRRGGSFHRGKGKRRVREERDLIFTDCILESFRTIGIILAYMILFMIGSALLQRLGFFTKNVPWMRAFLCGTLELTSGCSQMSLWDGNLTLRLTLTSWILSFGGLSVLGQTMSMLSGTSVTMAQVLKLKLIHGTFSAILTFIICAFVV